MNQLIPDNAHGKQTSLKHKVIADSPESAFRIFETARERLLKPNDWYSLCGNTGAGFEVVESAHSNNMLDRAVRHGDYIRIDIPGPGPRAGDGYDWVRVAMIETPRINSHYYNEVGIKLVACSSPRNPDSESAHFFSLGASSTLIIQQQSIHVTAMYYGRNETINNHTKVLADNIRNTVMAIGAMVGLSELHWERLIRSFLSTP